MKFIFLLLCLAGFSQNFLSSHENLEPWPGFSPRAFLLAEKLIRSTGWVVLLTDDEVQKPLWIKEIHYVMKDNGFLGMKINGILIKENQTYIQYGPVMASLQSLFTINGLYHPHHSPTRLGNLEQFKLH